MRNKEEQEKTKEQLIAEGVIRPNRGEVYEDSSFGKKTLKYHIYQGCHFKNHDFSNTEFIECDFRWSKFENCKGIELIAVPGSDIALPKLDCLSSNFVNCNFTECVVVAQNDKPKGKNAGAA